LKAIYSFVIDGDQKFELQTRVFLKTLLATGVEPSCIVAHYTPSASLRSLELTTSFGVELSPLEPIFDRKYCNKLAQLPVLIPRPADVYVLCDTDIAFVGRLDALFCASHIRAKPVDFENPPIAVLEHIRHALKIRQSPRIVEASCDGRPTYSVNCNGGVYIFPHALAKTICDIWQRETALLSAHKHIFEPWFHHADQIGFAMAMLSCGLDVEEIPIEYNFPMHLGSRFASFRFGEPKVLHYHWMQERDGLLKTTGHHLVDIAIARANRIIAR
jgi:hypothetical protein